MLFRSAEKVKEINTPEEINKFFPNPVFRSNLMNTNMYLTGIKWAMEYKVAQMKGDKQALQDIEDGFASLKRTGLTYNSYATLEKVIQNFSKNPNFFKIVSAVFEHGIEIDDASVNKIEVLKGPASLVYGSDAMAGVINIISNVPVPDRTLKINLGSNLQSNNALRSFNGNIAGNKNGINWNA